MSRLRFYIAGLVAIFLGMPLTEKAFAGGEDVVWSAIDLGFSLADSSSGVS